jgi:hypothetical protein
MLAATHTRELGRPATEPPAADEGQPWWSWAALGAGCVSDCIMLIQSETICFLCAGSIESMGCIMSRVWAGESANATAPAKRLPAISPAAAKSFNVR